MSHERGFAIAGLTLVVVLLLGSSALAAQSNNGFATYQLNVTSPKGDRSVMVNETVGPSDKAGYSDLMLQFIGTEQNFTYSRFVNSSDTLFPYLPFVGNQSIQYSNGTLYSIRVNITTTGTTSITFKGSQYTMNLVAVSAFVRYDNMSAKANGTVETFPSTLVYSAELGNSTYSLKAVLQATDLPLNVASSQMATAAVVSAGIGIGAVAVIGAVLFRRREHKVATQKEKPLHWVD